MSLRSLRARLRRLETRRAGDGRLLLIDGPTTTEAVAGAVRAHRERTGWAGPVAVIETRPKAPSMEAWALAFGPVGVAG